MDLQYFEQFYQFAPVVAVKQRKTNGNFLSLLFVNNDLYVCFIRASRSIIIGPVYLPATRRQIKVAPLFSSTTAKVTVFTPPRNIDREEERTIEYTHIWEWEMNLSYLYSQLFRGPTFRRHSSFDSPAYS